MNSKTPKHNGLTRASKKTMRRLERYWRFVWWSEFGWGTYQPYFAKKNRAKLGARNVRRVFGVEDEAEC